MNSTEGQKSVTPPVIKLTAEAKTQIDLIIEHDFTLSSQLLRLSITGKGCDGFDYGIGFDSRHENDIQVNTQNISFVFDPFCAFYLQECTIDYQREQHGQSEGFVIINTKQEQFKGKFWKKDPSKAPELN